MLAQASPVFTMYRIRWAGAQYMVGHGTWEPLDNLQALRVKALVGEYNEAQRSKSNQAN